MVTFFASGLSRAHTIACSFLKFGPEVAQFTLVNAVRVFVAPNHGPIYIVIAEFAPLGLNRVRLNVHQAVIVHVLHVAVELVDDGQRVRHLKSFYVLLAYILQGLEYGPQCVLVRHYYNALILHHLLGDYILPER